MIHLNLYRHGLVVQEIGRSCKMPSVARLNRSPVLKRQYSYFAKTSLCAASYRDLREIEFSNAFGSPVAAPLKTRLDEHGSSQRLDLTIRSFPTT